MKIKTIIRTIFAVIFLIVGVDYLGFSIFLAKNGEETGRIATQATIGLAGLALAVIFFVNAWNKED